jgi:hypothetical protein
VETREGSEVAEEEEGAAEEGAEGSGEGAGE